MSASQDDTDRALILAAMKFRDGQYYMGSIATAGLYHTLGLEYGAAGFNDALAVATRAQLDKLLDQSSAYIKHMQKFIANTRMDVKATIPAMALFNRINGLLQHARNCARNQFYDVADQNVASALVLVEILQTYVPDEIVNTARTMQNRRDSLSGVGEMFEYQMQRWGVSKIDLDDNFWSDDV